MPDRVNYINASGVYTDIQGNYNATAGRCIVSIIALPLPLISNGF